MKIAHSLFCMATVLGAVACGGSDKTAKDPSSASTTTTTTETTAMTTPAEAPAAPAAAPVSTATTASNAAPTAEVAPLTDEQILAISDAANMSEVEEAKLATTKAKNPEVKKFASMMIAHHTDAKKKGDKTAAKAKLTPAESMMSAQFKADAQSGLEALKGKTGADFDKAYIDDQVKAHTMVLDAIDTKLMPSVKNADLKAALTELRPKVEEHLKAAKAIQAKLQ